MNRAFHWIFNEYIKVYRTTSPDKHHRKHSFQKFYSLKPIKTLLNIDRNMFNSGSKTIDSLPAEAKEFGSDPADHLIPSYPQVKK